MRWTARSPSFHKRRPVPSVILQDIRYALRGVRNSPLFTATAILILALSIGGNTAMFTVIRAVLLKPLDYGDPDRLVWIDGGATPTRFEEMKAGAQSFSGFAAYTPEENLTRPVDRSRRSLRECACRPVSRRYWAFIRLLGGGFVPADDAPGGPSVAMISADCGNGVLTEIRGSSAKLSCSGPRRTPSWAFFRLRLQFPYPEVDAWMTQPEEWPLMQPESRRLSPFLTVFGRLKPGVGIGTGKC